MQTLGRFGRHLSGTCRAAFFGLGIKSDDTAGPADSGAFPVVSEREPFHPIDLIISFLALGGATLLSLLFRYWGFSEANLITVYQLGVLVTAITTSRRIYSLVSSIVSVLVFNFLFTSPYYTLMAYDTGYPVTFLVMLFAAFLSSTMAVELRQQARRSAQVAYRTQVLLDTNQQLQKAGSHDEILDAAAMQLTRLLHRDLVCYPVDNGTLTAPKTYGGDPELSLSPKEREAAAWAMQTGRPSGATTDAFPGARYLYFTIQGRRSIFSVIGISMDLSPLDAFTRNIILSILSECAMSLDNEQMAREKEAAAVLAKNEQLRADLLRSISHDLRTPLTSISGNAGNLLSNEALLDPETRRQIYSDIYDDSLWLINLVENLLSVTRLGSGETRLNLRVELISEVVAEALQHIDRKKVEHTITVHHSDELLMAKMDARLMIQVIINLVDNAIKYTPPGSTIAVTTEKRNGLAVISVADDGPGIPDETKPKVFDMFFSGHNQVVDSRRSMGLGLYLCKSILEAHGGAISVGDNRPHGAVFTVTLPAEEVTLHE